MELSRPTIRFKRLPGGEELPVPSYETEGAAGMDLRAALAAAVVLGPLARALVPTGFAVEIPPGYEGQVRPRSGLAAKHGLGVVNAPGTVDSDYRGEIKVILINFGSEPVEIRRGDRVAQLVIAPVAKAWVEEACDLGSTGRGAGGFGHTGVS